MAEQLDWTTSLIDPKDMSEWPIASRDDVLKCFSEILLNRKAKDQDRIKSGELIGKMQGYFKSEEKPDETPQPAQIIFTMKDARAEPPSDWVYQAPA